MKTAFLALLSLSSPFSPAFGSTSPNGAGASAWSWVCSAYYLGGNPLDYRWVYGDASPDKVQASASAMDACKRTTPQTCKPSSCWRYTPTWRVGVGPYVPASSPDFGLVSDRGGLSRNRGGERVDITFGRARTVTGARLTVYGKGNKGRVLVHSAILRPLKNNAVGEVETVSEKMLAAGESLDLSANGKLGQLSFTLEGYDVDGMSVALDLAFAAPGAPENEIALARTFPDPEPDYIFADTEKECASEAEIAAFGFHDCPYGAKVLDPWHGTSQFVCQTPGAPDENGLPTCLEGYMQEYFLAEIQCRAKK
jgi:hypothetical protein